MTIIDLYNWAVENGVEDFEICLTGDAGGDWHPDTIDIEIDTRYNEIIL